MLAIRPVTYEVETSLSPKRVLRKLDGDLIEHRPTINILSQSKFMKNHRDDTIFYGYRTDAESFQIFHHTAQQAFMARQKRSPTALGYTASSESLSMPMLWASYGRCLCFSSPLCLWHWKRKQAQYALPQYGSWDCSSCSGTTRRSSSEPISTASRLPSAKQTKAKNNIQDLFTISSQYIHCILVY